MTALDDILNSYVFLAGAEYVDYVNEAAAELAHVRQDKADAVDMLKAILDDKYTDIRVSLEDELAALVARLEAE